MLYHVCFFSAIVVILAILHTAALRCSCYNPSTIYSWYRLSAMDIFHEFLHLTFLTKHNAVAAGEWFSASLLFKNSWNVDFIRFIPPQNLYPLILETIYARQITRGWQWSGAVYNIYKVDLMYSWHISSGFDVSSSVFFHITLIQTCVTTPATLLNQLHCATVNQQNAISAQCVAKFSWEKGVSFLSKDL